MTNHAAILCLANHCFQTAFKPGYNTDTPSRYKAYFSLRFLVQCNPDSIVAVLQLKNNLRLQYGRETVIS